MVQREVSALSTNYLCGSFGDLLKETVTSDTDASVGCDCSLCNCGQWFHCTCVQYKPSRDDSDDDDNEWMCAKCTQSCI